MKYMGCVYSLASMLYLMSPFFSPHRNLQADRRFFCRADGQAREAPPCRKGSSVSTQFLAVVVYSLPA